MIKNGIYKILVKTSSKEKNKYFKEKRENFRSKQLLVDAETEGTTGLSYLSY